MEKNQLWSIIGVAFVVAVLASITTVYVTGNVIHVLPDKPSYSTMFGKTPTSTVYTVAEIDAKLKNLNATIDAKLNKLNATIDAKLNNINATINAKLIKEYQKMGVPPTGGYAMTYIWPINSTTPAYAYVCTHKGGKMDLYYSTRPCDNPEAELTKRVWA